MKIKLSSEEVPFWTGKDNHLYYPKNINLTMENDAYGNVKNDKLNKVIIKNGKIISGGLDKSNSSQKHPRV